MAKPIADDLTEEQVVTLLDWANYSGWIQTAADCHVALHGVKLPLKSRRQHQRYSKTDPGYFAARARVAKLLKNERIAKELANDERA